jgi:hypothetical protein
MRSEGEMLAITRSTGQHSTSVERVTVTLTVRTAPWRAHVARLASEVEGLVPVVKGNGYGFGRIALAGLAAEFCDTLAVGTIHELQGLPDGIHPVVLTPTLVAPPATTPTRYERCSTRSIWSSRCG